MRLALPCSPPRPRPLVSLLPYPPSFTCPAWGRPRAAYLSTLQGACHELLLGMPEHHAWSLPRAAVGPALAPCAGPATSCHWIAFQTSLNQCRDRTNLDFATSRLAHPLHIDPPCYNQHDPSIALFSSACRRRQLSCARDLAPPQPALGAPAARARCRPSVPGRLGGHAHSCGAPVLQRGPPPRQRAGAEAGKHRQLHAATPFDGPAAHTRGVRQRAHYNFCHGW